MPEADEEDLCIEIVLPVDRYEDYAKRLKEYRKRHRLKQAELAALLEVNPYTLRGWEQGIARPPYHIWRKIWETIQKNDSES